MSVFNNHYTHITGKTTTGIWHYKVYRIFCAEGEILALAEEGEGGTMHRHLCSDKQIKGTAHV